MKRFDPVLAICGGGNAGHALAVVTSQRFNGEVRWLVGSDAKARILREGASGAEGLQSTGAIVSRANRIGVISSDPEQVIAGADVVIVAVPAFAHGIVLRRIAPHLKASALIGALPTRGGFDFEATSLLGGIAPRGRRILFGLQTLPWSSRVREPGRTVHIGAVKESVLMSTLPSNRAPAVAEVLTEILGTRIAPTKSFLSMTLGNPGQIIHPGLMYGLFHTWRGERCAQDAIPYFYRDTSDEAGRFVERLSADACAVAGKLQTITGDALDLEGVRSIHDWLRRSYSAVTSDTGSVASCFRTGPLQARLAPMVQASPGEFVPDFAYRYLSEDVPYGLAVTKAIAQIAGTRTPAIDTVLRWAQKHLGTTFLRDGALDMESLADLPLPQNYGIESVADLAAWYAPVRTTIGSIPAGEPVAS